MRRTTRGANWNVVAMTDMAGQVIEWYTYTPYRPAEKGDRHRDHRCSRCQELRLVRSQSPFSTGCYGQITVDQVTSWGNRDGDDDVDSYDKGTPGMTCSTMEGACRVVDLDPVLDSSRPALLDRRAATRAFARGDVSRIHRDYDAADGTLFDSLPAGLARHPAKLATGLSQPFGHQGLLYDAEITSYQNRARQYLPRLRRFAQRDPLASQSLGYRGYQDGMNQHNYTGSNPASRRDPAGTWVVRTSLRRVPRDAVLTIGKAKANPCTGPTISSGCSGYSWFLSASAGDICCACNCIDECVFPASKRSCVRNRLGCRGGAGNGTVKCHPTCSFWPFCESGSWGCTMSFLVPFPKRSYDFCRA